MALKRIGLGLESWALLRLQEATKRLGIPQSRLVAAAVSVLTDKEQRDMLARYDILEEIERELRSAADKTLLQHIRGKTPDDLKVMLAAAKAVP